MSKTNIEPAKYCGVFNSVWDLPERTWIQTSLTDKVFKGVTLFRAQACVVAIETGIHWSMSNFPQLPLDNGWIEVDADIKLSPTRG